MILYIFLFIIGYLVYFYWNVLKYPKGPFPIPFFGNALQVEPNNLQANLEKWREIYGNVYTIWLINRPIVVLMRLNEIKEALVTKGEVFANRTGDFPEDIFMTIENGGVLFSSGENWREQRRTALHILRDFGVGKNIMEEQVHEQLENFIKVLKENIEKNSIEFRWPIQILVANIINKLLYGFSYPHSDCDRLMSYAETFSSVSSGLWENPFMLLAQAFPIAKKLPYIGYQAVGKNVEMINECLEFVKKDVKDTLKNYSKEDDPNCFVQAYYQKIDTTNSLTMDQLYNVCSDFFMAGMETTSTTLRWAVLYFAKYPVVQEKLRREIANVIGFERFPSLRDKNDMPYTTAFISELQRCANILPINLLRRTNADVEIGGKFLPAGTNVIPQIYGANLDETYFKNAYEFKPERFMNDDSSLNMDLLSHIIPFSIGKRQCAGESLARVELFLGVTTLIQKFKFFPTNEVDLSPIFGTVLFPKPNYLRLEEVDPFQYI